MHYTIHEADGRFHVWAEVEPQMYMQMASFEFREDAKFFVDARMTPIDLGDSDLVADDLASDGMEAVLRKYIHQLEVTP